MRALLGEKRKYGCSKDGSGLRGGRKYGVEPEVGEWQGCVAMSASLIRRGLELLEAPGQGKAPPALQQGRDGTRPAGAARRRKVTAGPGKNKATIKGRVVKSAIEEYHKKKAVNHLKANLLYMTSGRCVADKAVTQQVLTQNRGRKSKDRPAEKKEKKPEGTVFTEEDFRKFEREYFGIP